MENNQQRQSTNNTGKSSDSFSNQQPGQQLPKDNEAEDANRFSQASGKNEEHSESSRPEAENETLGTP